MTLEGVDVSTHQATTPPLDGVDFLGVRATFGTTPDAMYVTHSGVARAKGIPVIAYHFGRNAQFGSIASQVEAFLGAAAGADGLALDFEKDVYGTEARPPMTVAEAREFVDRVHAKGRHCGLYASTAYPYPEVGQDWRWVADYRSAVVTAGGPPIPWDLWQYTSSPLDRNRFRGTLAELRTLIGASAATQPTPIPGIQLRKPLAGGSVTQEFGPPAPVVALREPLGYVGRDDHGFLRRAVSNYPGATYYDHFHDALDWAAPLGTPLLAPADGKIVRVATWTDGNRYLAVEIAPGVQAWYWHCQDWADSVVGKTVRRGAVVAHMGSTGNSTGSHVHFEVRVLLEGTWYWYNPARLLEGGDLAISAAGYVVPASAAPGGDPMLLPNRGQPYLYEAVIPIGTMLHSRPAGPDYAEVRPGMRFGYYAGIDGFPDWRAVSLFGDPPSDDPDGPATQVTVYAPASAVVPIAATPPVGAPAVVTAGGYSQAQLDAALEKAEQDAIAELNTRIDAAQKEPA